MVHVAGPLQRRKGRQAVRGGVSGDRGGRPPHGLAWDNVTLAHWPFTFSYTSTQSAIVNSRELGVLTACAGTGLAALAALAVPADAPIPLDVDGPP